jgi:hypothetical protein
MTAAANARRKAEAISTATCRCHQHIRRSSRVPVFAIQQHAVSRLMNGRSLSSQKGNDLDTISKNAKPQEIPELSSSTSTTTGQTIWRYTKQFSSSLYVLMRDSATGTIVWTGAKVAAFAERSKDRIKQKIHSSVESTKSNISNRAQVFQEEIKSSVRRSTDSFVQSILGPFKSFGNFIANQWQTTPIWSRFFWWSLSAIAVYGVATTVPKEIVKYAFFSTTTADKPTTTSGKSRTKSEDDVSELVAED